MDVKKKSFIEAMKSSLGNITKSCEALGISRQTYYNWLEDEVFKSEIDNIGEYVLDFAEHSLFKQIKENNTTATIFYLKTKGKHRGYVEKQEIDHTTKGEAIVDKPNLSKLTTEQLQALASIKQSLNED